MISIFPRAALLLVVGVLGAACSPADGVEVEPLPPLERPALEARAGLASLQGAWRFAGWEVAGEAVAEALGAPAPPGDVLLQTQRVDSLAGFLVRGDQRMPLVGEVRRDGTVALVAIADGGDRRFAAGRVGNDTLWIDLSTLPAGELSPPSVRWAFVRGTVGQAFVRLPSGRLLRDTVVAGPDTMPPVQGRRPPRDATPPAAPPTAPPEEVPAEPGDPASPPAEEPAPRPEREPATGVPRVPAIPPPDSLRIPPPPGPDVDIPPAVAGDAAEPATGRFIPAR